MLNLNFKNIFIASVFGFVVVYLNILFYFDKVMPSFEEIEYMIVSVKEEPKLDNENVE